MLAVIGTWAAHAADHLTLAVSFAIGAGLGAAELLARYRDDPLATLGSTSGMVYMAINGAAGALALWLMQLFDVGFGFTDQTQKAVVQVAAAGLAAMAFFRSGLFTIRVGGSDLSVGPNLILESLLHAVDRHHDRSRARPRSTKAASIMAGVSFDRAKAALPDHCFNLMQNVSPDEQRRFGETVRDIEESEGASGQAKSINLGLALLNIVGEQVLEDAVRTLRTDVTGPPALGLELQAANAASAPSAVLGQLTSVCEAMASAAKQTDLVPPDISGIQALEISDDNKALLVVRALVGVYGEGIVAPALVALAPAPNQGGGT